MNSPVKLSAKVYFLIALAITISISQFYYYKKSQERQSLLNQFFIVSSRIRNETAALKSQVLLSYFDKNIRNVPLLFQENLKTIEFAKNLINKYDIIPDKKSEFLKIINELYDVNAFGFELYLSSDNEDKKNILEVVNYLSKNYESLNLLTMELIEYTDTIAKKYERANLLFSFASVILIISILSFVIVPQIAELEKLNQELNASNLLRESIQDSSPNGIFFVNNELKVQLLNEKAKEIIKLLSNKQITEGEDLSNIFLEKDLRALFFKNIEESKEKKFSHDYISINTPNPYHFKILFYAVKNSIGNLRGTTIIFSDITTEVISQQRLKRSENYFRTLIDKSHGIIFSLDHLLSIKYVSPAIEYYSKYQVNKILGRPFVELINNNEKEKILSYLIDKINLEKMDNSITFSIKGLSNDIVLLANCGVIENEETNLKELILVCMDITEQIEAEKRLKEQNKKLREIAWIQSHVVRKPVANALGLIQLLQQSNDLQKNSTEFQLNEKELYELLKKELWNLDEIIRQINEKTKEI
ncbi:PAS domain-containing protein [Schleiferia thermophila]